MAKAVHPTLSATLLALLFYLIKDNCHETSFACLAGGHRHGVPIAVRQCCGAQTPLRVITHSSFDMPKELLAKFEAEAGVKLTLIKGGDAG